MPWGRTRSALGGWGSARSCWMRCGPTAQALGGLDARCAPEGVVLRAREALLEAALWRSGAPPGEEAERAARNLCGTRASALAEEISLPPDACARVRDVASAAAAGGAGLLMGRHIDVLALAAVYGVMKAAGAQPKFDAIARAYVKMRGEDAVAVCRLGLMLCRLCSLRRRADPAAGPATQRPPGHCDRFLQQRLPCGNAQHSNEK